MQDYRQLTVWHAAMDLAETTYHVTGDYPGDERFGLIAQMRRTAVSVPSNIAEGCGRRTRGELRQFLGIALGAIHELDTQVMLSTRLGYLDLDSPIAASLKRTLAMLLRFTTAVDDQRRAP